MTTVVVMHPDFDGCRGARTRRHNVVDPPRVRELASGSADGVARALSARCKAH